MKVHVDYQAPAIVLAPSMSGRIQDVFPTVPIGWDPVIKRYVLRPADFPELVASAAGSGVELVPSTGLAAGLRTVAMALRQSQGFVDQLPADLFPFQRTGAAFLHGNPGAFLFDEMGLGKTVQALAAIGPGTPVLVVCPASLRRNWEREVKRWRPDLDAEVIEQRNSFRWPSPDGVVIVSYAGLPAKPDKFGKAPKGLTVIADEAHAVKHYGSSKNPVQRTRRFRLVSRRARKAGGGVWMMTGTPVMTRPSDLWGLLQAQELGPKLYLNQGRFIKLFGGFKDGLGVVRWDPKAIDPDAMEPLRGYVLRRKRADVLKDMPPKMRTTHIVELTLPPDVDQSLREVDAAYADMLEAAAEAADESLDYFGGIDQLAYARRQLATAKIPAVMDLADQFAEADEPVVVFSVHRAPVEALGSREGWGAVLGGMSGKEKQRAVDDFQAGNLKGIALTIGAGGMGFTLTRSAHAVFVDRAWNPTDNFQAEDRVARIGQKRPVTVTSLVADHPLDERVAVLLERKLDTIDRTTERLNDDGRDTHRLQTAEALERIASLIERVS